LIITNFQLQITKNIISGPSPIFLVRRFYYSNSHLPRWGGLSQNISFKRAIQRKTSLPFRKWILRFAQNDKS